MASNAGRTVSAPREQQLPGTDLLPRILLGVVCVVSPLGTALIIPGETPLSFLVTLIVHLLAVAYIGWRARHWWRRPRRARVVDYVAAAVPLPAGVLALLLVRLVAYEYGILGSALPRVRQGIPLPADIPYLMATAAILLVLATALGQILLLVRTRVPADAPRRLAERVRARLGSIEWPSDSGGSSDSGRQADPDPPTAPAVIAMNERESAALVDSARRSQDLAEGHHWHEYPVGFGGELARAFVRTLIPFACGIGASFALLIGFGILVEEGLVSDALEAAGWSADRRIALTDGLDQLFRMSLVPLMIIGYVAGLGICIALVVRNLSTSRAIAAAASAGAPRTAVPHPVQIEHLIRRPMRPLWFFTIANLGVLGILVVLFGIFLIVEPSGGLALAFVLGAGYLTALTVLTWQLRRRLNPVHELRRRLVAGHWSNTDESAAWHAARKQNEVRDGVRPVAARRVAVANRLTGLGAVVAVLAVTVFRMSMFVRFPQATRTPQGRVIDKGPRAEYGPVLERVLDGVLWLLAGGVVFALVVLAVGGIIEHSARSSQRAWLQDLLREPKATRPPEVLLERYAERRSVPLAIVFAVVAGVGLVFGASSLILGLTDAAAFFADVYQGSNELFAGFVRSALLTVLGSLVLLVAAYLWNALRNARGQQLRNQLMARWPTVPERKTDSDGKPLPSRVGPALTSERR